MLRYFLSEKTLTFRQPPVTKLLPPWFCGKMDFFQNFYLVITQQQVNSGNAVQPILKQPLIKP